MKVGLYFDLRNPGRSAHSSVYERALRTCELGEALGADSVWLSEHHGVDDGYLPQPLVFAAAVAARTTRVRVGTAATLAPLRHPVHLAEEAAVVDVISAGRLELGLGSGYLAHEYALFQTQFEKPLKILFDKVDEVRSALRSPGLTPRPVQPSLPLWVAGGGPRAARRTGQAGLRLLSADRRLEAPYIEGLFEAGFDLSAAHMAGPVNIFLSEEPERVAPVVEEAYEYLWASYNSQAVRSGARPPAPAGAVEARAGGLDRGMRGLLIATPDHAAELVCDHYTGSNVGTVFTWAMLPGVPAEPMQRHVELWSSTFRAAIEDV
ncbi:LLM class flavin-dependent oxidoreductase [Actinomadura sp. 1N219]|uniref:LLM class flavin-dependent oxidoreductase n=1 Tax=Actinomadura sp. 1N219 TaxID=3375152 RepID=UPI0037BB918C